jgi:hypothetical protein
MRDRGGGIVERVEQRVALLDRQYEHGLVPLCSTTAIFRAFLLEMAFQNRTNLLGSISRA